MRLYRCGWVVTGLLAVLASCKPSADELARKAEAADAADKERARKIRSQRQAAEKAEQNRPRDLAENSSVCRVTAERMIERMETCGLNMEGITVAKLCSTFGQVKLNFLASRTCNEIGAMLSLE